MAGSGLTPAQMAQGFDRLSHSKLWRAELTKANRPVARRAAADARAEMRSGDAQLVAAAAAVRPRVDPQGAAVAVSSSGKVPFALAAVWGRKGPSGWNRHVYDREGQVVRRRRLTPGAFRQHPQWVGAAWKPATRGEGPRGLNDGLAKGLDGYVEEHARAVMSVFERAFPRGLD